MGGPLSGSDRDADAGVGAAGDGGGNGQSVGRQYRSGADATDAAARAADLADGGEPRDTRALHGGVVRAATGSPVGLYALGLV